MPPLTDAHCTYSVVVPCYGSGSWLDELVERTRAAMAGLREDFEILLVNDASPDDTWRAIERACQRHPTSLRGFDLLFNVGQFRATLCGLEHARGQFVITMDDDLQHRPEDIPALVHALRADPGLDCVVGTFRHKHRGPLRRLGGAVNDRVRAWLLGTPPGLRLSAFRVMRSSVAAALCAHRTARPNLGWLVLGVTRRIANVEVEHERRERGTSGYSLPRLAGIFRDTLVGSSALPLQLVGALGAAAVAGSLLLGLWRVARALTGAGASREPTSEILLIAFFGGATLLAIGLLGEYVARILGEVSGPPRYQLRRVVGAPGSAPERRDA